MFGGKYNKTGNILIVTGILYNIIYLILIYTRWVDLGILIHFAFVGPMQLLFTTVYILNYRFKNKSHK